MKICLEFSLILILLSPCVFTKDVLEVENATTMSSNTTEGRNITEEENTTTTVKIPTVKVTTLAETTATSDSIGADLGSAILLKKWRTGT